jgi:hypothetical protein
MSRSEANVGQKVIMRYTMSSLSGEAMRARMVDEAERALQGGGREECLVRRTTLSYL